PQSSYSGSWGSQPGGSSAGNFGGGQSWNSSSFGRMQSEERSSHRGRGPKGYQRSDERIQEEINDRLTDDHDIDAGEIEVKVHEGEVTLTGTVSDRETKRMVEDLVESLSGVREVQNNLRVRKYESSRGGNSGERSSSSGSSSSERSSSERSSSSSKDRSSSNAGSSMAGSSKSNH
ncbi:MAG TPA: BON domain-containing protein, partial [Planctomycetota bacterium]|nr:BON domain-containing protein [Planctomycetota bacterium]